MHTCNSSTWWVEAGESDSEDFGCVVSSMPFWATRNPISNKITAKIVASKVAEAADGSVGSGSC